MKKILLTALLSMCVMVGMYAAKANTRPFTVVQPDGKELSVRLFGDEHFNWYATTDGVILVNTGKAYYIAAIDSNGNISSTNVLAHNAGERSQEELHLIASQDKDTFFNGSFSRNVNAKAKSVINGNASPKYFPHKGSPKVVVLLVQFQDTKFLINSPVEAFNEFFNKEKGVEFTDYENYNACNYGSVKQYFNDMSSGDFTPEFVVYDKIITVPHDMVYYGGTDPNGRDENSDQLVIDAVNLSKDDIDYSQYDYNNDDVVDLIYIIYAGSMQNWGGSNESIWAKASWVVDKTVNGIPYKRYCMSGELCPSPTTRIASIGVACHEFSHCLGLPDMYPNNTNAGINNQAMEYWDLMDGGEYNITNGYVPTPYTAWEKQAMEWPVDIQTLTAEDQEMDLSTPTLNGGKAYKIENPQDEKEYFMLENIQPTGWNSGASGSGILAYHVNYQSNTVNVGDYPNNTPGKPGMAVIPADGIIYYCENVDNDTYEQSLVGDLFNTQNGLELNDALGLPNYVWYTGSHVVEGQTKYPTNKAVTFSFEGSNISLNYTDDVASAIQHIEFTPRNLQDNKIYTLDGRFVGTDKGALQKGIYIINNKKVVIK